MPNPGTHQTPVETLSDKVIFHLHSKSLLRALFATVTAFEGLESKKRYERSVHVSERTCNAPCDSVTSFMREFVGLPCEGMGAKKFSVSLEAQGSQTFWRNILGFLPGAPKRSKKIGSILGPH